MTTQLAVRLPDDLLRRLDELVPATHANRSDAVRRAIELYVYRLASEHDAEAYERFPLTDEELSLRRSGNMEICTSLVRGEVWWAATPSGDRPVLVLTRDPTADRIGAVVVATCTRTSRNLNSELPLGIEDGLPESCVALFDNLYTLRKHAFRQRISRLTEARMAEACNALAFALGCW